MSTPVTVNRRDISVEEERDYHYAGDICPDITWSASLCGNLSTGEQVSITRSGDTFTAALTGLETAIKNEGWSIR